MSQYNNVVGHIWGMEKLRRAAIYEDFNSTGQYGVRYYCITV